MTLNEKQQKTYLKLSNLIKKYSKLANHSQEMSLDDPAFSLEKDSRFYGPYLKMGDVAFLVIFSLLVTIVWAFILSIIHFIVEYPSKELAINVETFLDNSLIYAFFVTFIISIIHDYTASKKPYNLSRDLSFEVFSDEELKKIFLENDFDNIVLSELPENKKKTYSDLKKYIQFLDKEGFYERIGLKEDKALTFLMEKYKFIQSKIKEEGATDLHKEYWKEKLSEFIEENTEIQKKLSKEK